MYELNKERKRSDDDDNKAKRKFPNTAPERLADPLNTLSKPLSDPEGFTVRLMCKIGSGGQFNNVASYWCDSEQVYETYVKQRIAEQRSRINCQYDVSVDFEEERVYLGEKY